MSTMKKMLSKVRKALDDYQMIQEGDKIGVGVSGGKDSVSLLVTLARLRDFHPIPFDIVGITLDTGLGKQDYIPLINLCKKYNIEFHIEPTQIGKIVLYERGDKNPCSLCANLRRGALNNTAKSLGCNKVALGHHKDDLIETLMMSLLYEGRIHTFSPVTHLQKTNLYVIRPLIYTLEKDIKSFRKSENLPLIKSLCEFDGHTTRQDMKDLLYSLNKANKYVKANIFGAIKRSHIEGWYTDEEE